MSSEGRFLRDAHGYDRGQNLGARPPVVRSVAEAWQTWFAHADYIWLDPSGGKNQIP